MDTERNTCRKNHLEFVVIESNNPHPAQTCLIICRQISEMLYRGPKNLTSEWIFIIFIPFPRVLVLCEMQLASSRIWTRVAVSISYDDNHYTTGTSHTVIPLLSLFSGLLWPGMAVPIKISSMVEIYLFKIIFKSIGLVGFYDISTIVGYLMPNSVYKDISNIWSLNTFCRKHS